MGVYDTNGNSALTCLLEKIPSVAYTALSQYQINDNAMGETHMYLNHLERDTTMKGCSFWLFFILFFYYTEKMPPAEDEC